MWLSKIEYEQIIDRIRALEQQKSCCKVDEIPNPYAPPPKRTFICRMKPDCLGTLTFSYIPVADAIEAILLHLNLRLEETPAKEKTWIAVKKK